MYQLLSPFIHSWIMITVFHQNAALAGSLFNVQERHHTLVPVPVHHLSLGEALRSTRHQMKSEESAKNPPHTSACCPIQPFLSMIHKIRRAAPKSLTVSFSFSLYLSCFFYFPRAEASVVFGVSKTHPPPTEKRLSEYLLHNLSFQSACNKNHYSSSPNVFLCFYLSTFYLCSPPLFSSYQTNVSH